MSSVELPALTIEAVAALVATSRPVVTNRDPAPDEEDVPLPAAIALEVIDPAADGIDRKQTKVWIDGQLAFDGSASPEIPAAFKGPRSGVSETSDTLRLTLDPVVPFASKAIIAVRVVAATKGGGSNVDETYTFVAEDRTAPKVVAAVATSPRVVRVAFDEAIDLQASTGFVFRSLDVPAVPLSVVDATVTGTVIDITVHTEMTPDARYRISTTGVVDLHGNASAAPFDAAVFRGFRAARPAARRFDLWSMLPKHNRRADLTGDLARFIACLQEILDLLLAEADRFPDILDLERAPAPFLDLILRDLGNPFPFDLDEIAKRRLAAVLVEMYREKGTAIGIRNAVRFFLGVDIEAITALAATALVLGESELDVDWELGPSSRFARYAFDVKVGRVLSTNQRRQLRTIVDYLKPAHTHFVNLIEPLPPIVPDHWEIGLSDLRDTTFLH